MKAMFEAGSLTTLCILLAMITISDVQAHGVAITIPDHDAVLGRSPETLRFVFKAPVTLTHLEIRISGGEQDGETIDFRLPRDTTGTSGLSGERVEIPIPDLGPNDYVVIWRGLSQGGDDLVDFFNFTIRQ